MAFSFIFKNPFSKIENCFLTGKLTLKIGNSAFTVSHGKYIKHVIFPWPAAVAAHDSKRLGRQLHSSGCYWKPSLRPAFRYVHHIVPIRSTCAEDCFLSKLLLVWQSVRLKGIHLNVLKNIHHRLSVWHFPRSSLPNDVAVAWIEVHRQPVENYTLVTPNIIYREVL